MNIELVCFAYKNFQSALPIYELIKGGDVVRVAIDSGFLVCKILSCSVIFFCVHCECECMYFICPVIIVTTNSVKPISVKHVRAKNCLQAFHR